MYGSSIECKSSIARIFVTVRGLQRVDDRVRLSKQKDHMSYDEHGAVQVASSHLVVLACSAPSISSARQEAGKARRECGRELRYVEACTTVEALLQGERSEGKEVFFPLPLKADHFFREEFGLRENFPLRFVRPHQDL